MAAMGYGIGAFAGAYGAAQEEAAAAPAYAVAQPEMDVLPAVMGIIAASGGNWQYRQGYHHHHHHYGMAPMFYR